jgi:hypothetical protein
MGFGTRALARRVASSRKNSAADAESAVVTCERITRSEGWRRPGNLDLGEKSPPQCP